MSGYNTTQTKTNGNTNIVIDSVNLGNLPRYLFFFADGHTDANWQGATKGFVGNVAVDGIQASERTSGDVPYAGTITTNDTTLGDWQAIIDQNPGQAFEITGATSVISDLESNLVSAFHTINALPATPGYTSVDSSILNGLNTQNGINETFVINITSGFQISDQLLVTGDPGDVYILRWDEGSFTPANGYQGQVKFQSGGAIVPQGGLTPSNFISVAGDIDASGGDGNPPPPYPQGPRFNNGQGALINGGQDFNGGGFFTGYWLTTGAPTTFVPSTGLWVGETHSLSNGIFVGGWYTLTTKFSMTSGTSGVYVSPNPATQHPSIGLVKLVSVDNGATYQVSHTAPGPALQDAFPPKYRFIITNTGDVPLDNVSFFDSQLNRTITLGTLNPQDVVTIDATGF
ncbi:MAG: hypothetical protein Q8934_07165 [Bacillota bacterium]|nr:hypothetical protein [Bacillota bacterium]